jgi:hypothetical protein
MRRLRLNTLLSLFASWLALLDHCLIETARMPISGEIALLLLVQASTIGSVALLANGAFPLVAAMATNGSRVRVQLFAFGLPLILFVISPVMISDSLYRARYGNLNRSVVRAHVWHDYECCLNPFNRGTS